MPPQGVLERRLGEHRLDVIPLREIAIVQLATAATDARPARLQIGDVLRITGVRACIDDRSEPVLAAKWSGESPNLADSASYSAVVPASG